MRAPLLQAPRHVALHERHHVVHLSLQQRLRIPVRRFHLGGFCGGRLVCCCIPRSFHAWVRDGHGTRRGRPANARCPRDARRRLLARGHAVGERVLVALEERSVGAREPKVRGLHVCVRKRQQTGRRGRHRRVLPAAHVVHVRAEKRVDRAVAHEVDQHHRRDEAYEQHVHPALAEHVVAELSVGGDGHVHDEIENDDARNEHRREEVRAPGRDQFRLRPQVVQLDRVEPGIQVHAGHEQNHQVREQTERGARHQDEEQPRLRDQVASGALGVQHRPPPVLRAPLLAAAAVAPPVLLEAEVERRRRGDERGHDQGRDQRVLQQIHELARVRLLGQDAHLEYCACDSGDDVELEQRRGHTQAAAALADRFHHGEQRLRTRAERRDDAGVTVGQRYTRVRRPQRGAVVTAIAAHADHVPVRLRAPDHVHLATGGHAPEDNHAAEDLLQQLRVVVGQEAIRPFGQREVVLRPLAGHLQSRPAHHGAVRLSADVVRAGIRLVVSNVELEGSSSCGTARPVLLAHTRHHHGVRVTASFHVAVQKPLALVFACLGDGVVGVAQSRQLQRLSAQGCGHQAAAVQRVVGRERCWAVPVAHFIFQPFDQPQEAAVVHRVAVEVEVVEQDFPLRRHEHGVRTQLHPALLDGHLRDGLGRFAAPRGVQAARELFGLTVAAGRLRRTRAGSGRRPAALPAVVERAVSRAPPRLRRLRARHLRPEEADVRAVLAIALR
mmetsp:Transcript_9659/g.23777  ORF Transcript_9659/g.23777 Transcript_9659/m.23777 type:complete len:725 (+) Transcript_9659:1453-3627(+)